MKKSKLKTAGSGFNRLVSRKEVRRILKKAMDRTEWEYVDLDREYWQNADDTVVIKVTHRGSGWEGLTAGLKIAEIVWELRFDEFHIQEDQSNGCAYVRLWWD